MRNLETYLKLAGVLHFALLAASFSTPRALDWRRNLASLHPFLRSLFWVYGAFIVLIIIGFGTITLLNSSAMASGEPLARTLCAFIAVFWLARLGVQWLVFDARPFLTNWFYRIGYHSLNFVFGYFTAVYGLAAIQKATL